MKYVLGGEELVMFSWLMASVVLWVHTNMSEKCIDSIFKMEWKMEIIISSKKLVNT
jgi:hypothetical protein